MKQNEDNGHFNIHMKAKVTLSKNLTLRAFGSYSYNSVSDSHYYPTSVWNRGEAYRKHEKNEIIRGNVSLTYDLKTTKSDAMPHQSLVRITGGVSSPPSVVPG